MILAVSIGHQQVDIKDDLLYDREGYRRMAVKNKVVQLMGKKQEAEGRVITAAVVARETNLTRQVIGKWMRNEVSEFRGDMIDLLCDYFDCDVPDLLYRERSTQTVGQVEGR
jgi:DNA-binding Xre family transcriptional regulator